MANRHIAERYATALAAWDLTSLRELVHPEIVVHYPQSGETFKGIDSYLGIIEEHPDLPDLEEMSRGSSARESVIVTTNLPFFAPNVTVIGDGDTFVGAFVAAYANGDIYHVASIVRIRDGLVIEDTAYFGPPFDPPEYRKKYQAS